MDLAAHDNISIYLTLRPLPSLAVQTLSPQSGREHAEHSCPILGSFITTEMGSGQTNIPIFHAKDIKKEPFLA